MKTFKVKGREDIRHIEDCKNIQYVLYNKGFHCSILQAHHLWCAYSEDHCASGWTSMNGLSSEEIYECVKEYIEEGADSGTGYEYF